MTNPTYYTLTVPEGSPDVHEASLRAGKLLSPSRDWQELFKGDYPEVWKNHEDDMSKLSAEWPTALLILKCTMAGPQGPDEKPKDHPDFTWVEYHQGGLVQKEDVRVDIPGFNPGMLRAWTAMQSCSEAHARAWSCRSPQRETA